MYLSILFIVFGSACWLNIITSNSRINLSSLQALEHTIFPNVVFWTGIDKSNNSPPAYLIRVKPNATKPGYLTCTPVFFLSTIFVSKSLILLAILVTNCLNS